MSTEIVWFENCSYDLKHLVGGKCSSLGELHSIAKRIGFLTSGGFAVTTVLYDDYIRQNKLSQIIETKLGEIDINNLPQLQEQSKALRTIVAAGFLSPGQKNAILSAYRELCKVYDQENLEVAVRSSALAEDLPSASFAGQHDTFLNVCGESDLLQAVKDCFASLFNGRAISYRATHHIEMCDIKISVAVQKMVRSDLGSAGVAFSLDPDTGYDKAIIINSTFGLGELVVSGGVKPDEFILDKRVLGDTDGDPILVKKKGQKKSKIIYDIENGGVKEIATTEHERLNFSLTSVQIVELGRYVQELEILYSTLFQKKMAVDVEWAIDGIDHRIYILQTRPETVHSNDLDRLQLYQYILESRSNVLVTGVAVGAKISGGKLCRMTDIHESTKFTEGDILVTEMTTPDWEPIMKISSGIITNKGGRTCHAAIIARELGINAIVGVGSQADKLTNEDCVTISCAEGETGIVYEGILPFRIDTLLISSTLKLPVKMMLNIGNPECSFEHSLIPNSGVGLVRLEFIVNNSIRIHPLALHHYPHIREDIREKIHAIIGETTGQAYYTQNLSSGLAKIASSFYPNDVIVRLSDFKSNEYRNLIGGELYEPHEENPMIGWRGASRYYSEGYKPAFQLECEAIRYARDVMKMTNIIVMIPFCRTPEECKMVLDTMASYGLVRGDNDLRVFLMCEIPSNVIEADRFSPMIDGVSIGGNDLLQLTLGVDRDSEQINYLSDDKNVSYRRLISLAIKTYHKHGVKVGFCGQQPSDSLEFCKFLIDEDIDSISVTPDSAIKTLKNLGEIKQDIA